MSGGKIPYHLRVNKFIERQLFIELLAHVDHVFPIPESVYVSLGGPYLEDHAAVHWRFGTDHLLSIEGDYTTYQRQLFNRPMELIDCRRCTTGDFIAGFDTFADEFLDKRFVIWLDYASAQKRQAQLRELQALVAVLAPGDVVKVTLNASLSTLFPADVHDEDEKQRAALDKLQRKLGDFFVSDPNDYKAITPVGVARVLVESIQKSVLDGLEGTPDVRLQPLALFRYSDGDHQMLTVTFILLSAEEQQDFLDSSRMAEWDWFCNTWTAEVHEISVPTLSIREKLSIDRLLIKHSNDEVHARMDFTFDKRHDRSMEILDNYVKHYRRCPIFVQVSR